MSSKRIGQRRKFLARLGTAGAAAMVVAAAGPIDVLAAGLQKKKALSLSTVTVDDFSPLAWQYFWLRPRAGGDAIAAWLVDVTPLVRTGDVPPALRQHREPFSVTFSVPESFDRTQRTYRLTHDTLGTFDVFMEPVDLPEHNRLEAVFG